MADEDYGQWGPEPFWRPGGRPVRTAVVRIYETDGTTLASVVADQAGTALANPLPVGVATGVAGVDTEGNCLFFAAPGAYVQTVTVNGVEVYRSRITVDSDVVGGAGGGAPSGPAGGVLAGTYPNPSFAADMALQSELDAEATTRAAADTALSGLVSAEATARVADVDAEEAARSAAITAEATARANADSAHASTTHGGSGVTHKRTVYLGADISTSSTTFVDIDAVNVPALSLTLAVGDDVELRLSAAFAKAGAGQNTLIDWLVDQPVSADVNVRGTAGGAASFQSATSAIDVDTRNAFGWFTATEAGVHTFKPRWRQNGGTATIITSSFGGTYNTALVHVVKNLGAPA